MLNDYIQGQSAIDSIIARSLPDYQQPRVSRSTTVESVYSEIIHTSTSSSRDRETNEFSCSRMCARIKKNVHQETLMLSCAAPM